MVISSTIPEHRDIQKITLESTDAKTFNQIHHLLIDARDLFNLIGKVITHFKDL